MATGHVTQSARVLRGGLSFAIAEQTAFWLVIALMLFLGVMMMIIAAWVYRSNDPEPEVLAPLELMSKSKFRDADPETQQRELDEARPPGATTLRSAVALPRARRRPTVASDLVATSGQDVEAADDVALSADVDHGTQAAGAGDAAKPRRPRRYLAGEGPAKRRAGAGRYDEDDDLSGDDYRDSYSDDDLGDDHRDDSADDRGRDDTEFAAAAYRDGDYSVDDYQADDYQIDEYEVDDYEVDAYRPIAPAVEDGDLDGEDLDVAALSDADALGDADRAADDELDVEVDVDGDDDVDTDADPAIDADDDDDADADRVHRRSRLPFRVFGTKNNADVDVDADAVADDADDAPPVDEYDDTDPEDDLVEDDLVDDQDEDPSDYDDDVDTSVAVRDDGPADDDLDDDPDPADGDTWLDRAEREAPSGGFRRERVSGGGRWRRRPAPVPGGDIIAEDEIDDLDEIDEIDVLVVDDADYDPESLTDQEEALHDMDFEHDDFDAYADRANRPGGAGDPFFEDDFDGEWNESSSPGRPRRRARRAAEVGTPTETPAPRRVPSAGMSTFDPDAMVDRFRERAAAVRRRPLPPVAGQERQEFIQQAKIDYQDFAMIGDAEVTIEDGVLVLRVDLRG